MTRWSDTPGAVDLIRFLVWKVHCWRCLRKRARTVGTWKAVEAKLQPTLIGKGRVRWSARSASF
jgi:hypothetical protein